MRTDSYVCSDCMAEHVAAWTTNRASPNGFPVVVKNLNILPRRRVTFNLAFFDILAVVKALQHTVLQMRLRIRLEICNTVVLMVLSKRLWRLIEI